MLSAKWHTPSRIGEDIGEERTKLNELQAELRELELQASSIQQDLPVGVGMGWVVGRIWILVPVICLWWRTPVKRLSSWRLCMNLFIQLYAAAASALSMYIHICMGNDGYTGVLTSLMGFHPQPPSVPDYSPSNADYSSPNADY